MDENVDFSDSTSRKRRLKKLLDKGALIREMQNTETSGETMDKISDIIKETDVINKHSTSKELASNTNEAVMDVLVIKMSHELLGGVISDLKSTAYSEDLMIEKYNDMDNPWIDLEKIVFGYAKFLSYAKPMTGALKLHNPTSEDESNKTVIAEKPARKSYKSRNKNQKLDHVERLQQIDDLGDGNAELVSAIYALIVKFFIENNNKPLPFYKLVCHPDNMMYTVQNIFKLAFLVKDNTIAIEMGEDGLPTVRPVGKEEKASVVDTEQRQTIMTINQKLCQEMVARYNIVEPMLPEIDDE